MTAKFCLFLLFILFLHGCSLVSNQPNNTTTVINQTLKERNQQMKALSQWQISGKIAFIQQDKRDSANLFWQHLDAQNQRLNLTTYLGINVLKLESKNGLHTLEVDGKTYQGDDLSVLIYQLTQLPLPTKALHYWLKGLPYLQTDQITLDEKTSLPKLLTSTFNQQKWQISYQGYQTVNSHQLATKLVIKQEQLTIKININEWKL